MTRQTPLQSFSRYDMARKHNYHSSRRPDEHRAKDYLRSKLRDELEGEGSIKYVLQIQLNDTENDHEVFNPNKPWDQTRFPFLTVAKLNLTTFMHQTDTEMLQFNVGRLPKSGTLKILPVRTFHRCYIFFVFCFAFHMFSVLHLYILQHDTTGVEHRCDCMIRHWAPMTTTPSITSAPKSMRRLKNYE
jgi:hypothetical protein